MHGAQDATFSHLAHDLRAGLAVAQVRWEIDASRAALTAAIRQATTAAWSRDCPARPGWSASTNGSMPAGSARGARRKGSDAMAGDRAYDGAAHGAYKPGGWHDVTPRIVVRDVEGLVAFMRVAFGAIGDFHASRPCEMRLGDSVVMVGNAAEREVMPAFLYLYVEDTDAVYRRAINAGATSIEEPREHAVRRPPRDDPGRWGTSGRLPPVRPHDPLLR